jgi:AraC-like DNA-binding protein
MVQRVSHPIAVKLPPHGVLFVESSHAGDFQMAPRRDPYHKILYVLAGQVAYRESETTTSFAARSGSVVVVAADVEHQISDIEPSTLLLLCCREELVEADADIAGLWRTLARGAAEPLKLSRPSRQRLESMWRRAMFEWEHTRVGSATTARALAAQTIVLLSRLPVESGGASAADRVEAVRDEIAETFYDEWDLDRAAARAGLSRRRFTELFRAANGQTFGAFLGALRLAHAARLLRAGEHSVTGVMFACGYNDVSHFYRVFRKKFGKPPRAWSEHQAS